MSTPTKEKNKHGALCSLKSSFTLQLFQQLKTTRTIDKKEFKYAKTEMFTTMQNCEGGFRRERLEKRKIGLRPGGVGS